MPISAPDPLLDIAGLSTGYGKIGVLRGVDLTVGAGEIAPGETHTSRPGQQARYRAQQRGLAGTIWAKQRHHLARANRHVDAAQHPYLAVTGREAGDIE